MGYEVALSLVSQQAGQPATKPFAYLEKWKISAVTRQILPKL
jgi:hypothetical protein